MEENNLLRERKSSVIVDEMNNNPTLIHKNKLLKNLISNSFENFKKKLTIDNISSKLKNGNSQPFISLFLAICFVVSFCNSFWCLLPFTKMSIWNVFPFTIIFLFN